MTIRFSRPSLILSQKTRWERGAIYILTIFRSMLFPRKFYEHNETGNPVYYSPYGGKIHVRLMYTDNGFWDTFRARFPLNAILHPEFHGNYVTSLITAYDQSGWLPYVKGLVDLLGGDKSFVAKPDSVFTAPNTFKVGTYNRVIHEIAEMEMINMGQYAHGNPIFPKMTIQLENGKKFPPI